MDDFNILTEEDKTRVSYGVCVAGSTIVGIGVGRFLGLQGVLAGAAAGAAWGLLTCKHLQAPIKQKLFSPLAKLSDHELTSALRAIRSQHPRLSKAKAMDMLAQARFEISRNPRQYRSALRA